MSGKMERLQFYLEPELNAALNKLAGEMHVSKAELIRRGVRNLLAEKEILPSDPARRIVGLFNTPTTTTTTNWATRHDELIYRRDWED